MRKNKKTIVIATGGTGGHIFPSVSLFNFLSDKYHVEFIIDERGLKYLGSQKNSVCHNWLDKLPSSCTARVYLGPFPLLDR